MSILDKHIEFVNSQIEFQEKQSQRFATNPYRRELHQSTALKFKNLLEDFREIDLELTKAANTPKQKDLFPSGIPTLAEMALKPEDIEGLPPEVIAELSVSGADPVDFNVIAVINEAGGILSLDRIVIGLYKMFGEKIKRPTLTSRLNRMIPKGLLFSVPNRKGLYSTTQLTTEGTPAQPEVE